MELLQIECHATDVPKEVVITLTITMFCHKVCHLLNLKFMMKADAACKQLLSMGARNVVQLEIRTDTKVGLKLDDILPSFAMPRAFSRPLYMAGVLDQPLLTPGVAANFS